MDKLIQGYLRFREEGWAAERDRWARLMQGQSPRIMVIACSDSRCDPATIFDTLPGEVFAVRNIANLVPPFEPSGRHGVSAAIEFAVTQLQVPQILVMGHGSCGGVMASLSRRFEQAEVGEGAFIGNWIELLDEARDRVLARCHDEVDCQHELELETVRTSLANLRTFPFVADAEQAGRLALYGAHFAIAEGRLYMLDTATDRFLAVTPASPSFERRTA